MRGPTLAATASVTRTEVPPQATASVTVATTYPDATLSLDGTMAPWLGLDRWTRCEVLLADESLDGITGTVEIVETEGSPIKEASFTVVDTRGTYADASAIVYGAPRIKVYVTSGTEDGRSEILMFDGYLESASNDDSFCPRTGIRASSLSRAWGDRGVNQGILSVPAFAGYTWGELIQLYAASSCTPLTDFRGELGDEVYTSFDVSGMSLVDLIQQWAPLIGIYLRETDGTLELVPERYVVGSGATPAYAFTPSDYLSVREEVPTRPTTAITASAVLPDVDETGAPDASLPETTISTVTVVNDDGSTTETITTTSWRIRTWATGAEAIRSVVEEVWTDTDPYGITAAFGWKKIRETTTEDFYPCVSQTIQLGQGVFTTRYTPTAQLTKTEQTVEAWYAPLTSVDYVGAEVFPDGSHHRTIPSWVQIEDSLTTYTYRQSAALGGECKLSTQVMLRNGYGSRLYPSGEQWDDGSYRAGVPGSASYPNYEQYGLLEEQTETWTDNGDDLNRSEPYQTAHTLEHKGWKSTGSAVVSTEVRPLDTYVIDYAEAQYRTALDSQRYEQLTVEGTVTKKEVVEGSIPEVPTASPTTPAYTESPTVITGASMRNIYPVSRESISIPDAQRAEEVYRYIARKLREALAVKYVVAHPMIPTLRVFDAVTLTDPTRGLTAAQGYVSAIRRSFDLVNGWAGMETTISVTPPELDPV